MSHPWAPRGPERSVASVAWRWRCCKICRGGDPAWNAGCGTGPKTEVRILQTDVPKRPEMDLQTPLTKRKKALVLHEDPTAGFKLADWFADHGYQAILTRTIDDIRPHLGDIRPDVIVVDCPPALTTTSDALPRLQAVCPTVPIIAVTHIGRPDHESRAMNQCKTMLGAGVFVCEAADSDQ